MELDGSHVLAKLGPGKKRQAQIDRSGIERVNCLGQRDAEVVVRVECSGALDQHLRRLRAGAPIAHRVRMGQGVARDLATNAEMVGLVCCARRQASMSRRLSR
jgi:hypothetical protein